jgi:hypothetical protein
MALLWLVTGFHRVSAIVGSLHLDPVGAVVLAVLMLLLLPSLILWGTAYISGAGFVVGAGSSFTPGMAHAGLLPSWPILGAVPDRPMPVLGSWAVIIPIVMAGVIGFVQVRRHCVAWASGYDADGGSGLAVSTPVASVDGSEPVATMEDMTESHALLSLSRAKGHPYLDELRKDLSTAQKIIMLAVVSAALAALAIGLLVALTHGGVGSGQLAGIGASGPRVAVYLFFELAGGTLLGGLAAWLWAHRP